MACDSPFTIENPTWPLRSKTQYIPVPCGKCPDCRTRHSNSWQFRLLQHEKLATSASFVTLTYDTDHVPISARGFMTLDKRDYQLFMKRLRKAHDKSIKLTYYAVGEYGSTTYRPHYHAIIFNADPEKIATAWTSGSVHVGTVSGASIAYTCKYLHKGKIIPVHRNDDRTPEFSLMSKKIGLNYMTENMLSYHKADLNRNYVTLPQGQKIPMPRYLREKIYSKQERSLQNARNEKTISVTLADTEAHYYHRSRDPLVAGYERASHEASKSKRENFERRARETRNGI